MGAVETVIVWENLGVNRYVLKNSTTGETIVKHLNRIQGAGQSTFRDLDTNTQLKAQNKKSLVEWLADEYKKFGCKLEIVTSKSREGAQFCRVFGGIGGILRYQLHFRSVAINNLLRAESQYRGTL